MKAAAILLLLGGLLALPCGRVSAQTDFSGTWALDREISADLTQATFERVAPTQAASPAASARSAVSAAALVDVADPADGGPADPTMARTTAEETMADGTMAARSRWKSAHG